MRDFQDEPDPRAGSHLTVPSDKDAFETGARAVGAIFRLAPPYTSEMFSRLRSRALALGHLNYASSAALTACLFGFAALLVGTHLLGPARTVVHQETAQSSATASTAQAMADAHAQTASVADRQPPQIPQAPDAGVSAITKPRPAVDRSEIGALPAAAPVKAERPRSKSAEKLSKAGQRVDRIGLTIAALLAAPPAADRSGPSAPAGRKLAQRGRGDAFDPARNPGAPGAPRPLGTIARAASAAEESGVGRRTNWPRAAGAAHQPTEARKPVARSP